MGTNLETAEDLFTEVFEDAEVFVDFYLNNRNLCDRLDAPHLKEIAQGIAKSDKDIPFNGDEERFFFDDLIQFVKKMCLFTQLVYEPKYILSAIRYLSSVRIY